MEELDQKKQELETLKAQREQILFELLTINSQHIGRVQREIIDLELMKSRKSKELKDGKEQENTDPEANAESGIGKDQKTQA